MQLTYNKRRIEIHKAYKNADFSKRKVLTNQVWGYVDFFIKKKEASTTGTQMAQNTKYYWEQAKTFLNAAGDLNNLSAPLVLYYGLLNASKAMLEIRKIPYEGHHGMSRSGLPKPGEVCPGKLKMKVSNENGVIPTLHSYYQTPLEKNNLTTLEFFLSKLPFVHRTFCHTYGDDCLTFFPVKTVSLQRSQEGFLEAVCQMSSDVKQSDIEIIVLQKNEQITIGISPSKVTLTSKNFTVLSNEVQESELDMVSQFNQHLKQFLCTITGIYPLWYLSGTNQVASSAIPATLGAMHLLSDLCRYEPLYLRELIDSEYGWLVSEFLEHAAEQFMDSIASEITGQVFFKPNVREPK